MNSDGMAACQNEASGLALVDERHPVHIEGTYPRRGSGNCVDRK